MRRRGILTLCWLIIVPGAQADILGVSDAALLANAIEQLNQLREQYRTLQQTYENAKAQSHSIDQIKNFNSGHYQFGDLNNSLQELKNRQWSPDTWDNALRNVAGGNPERYKALVKDYEKRHPVVDDIAFEKGANKERLALYKQGIQINKAASVESTYAYNEINHYLKDVHQLSAQIEKAPNTKSAIDLNSRLLAEIAYIQTQNLKIQTLISQQLVQSGINEIASESSMARFNRLPDE
jgi:type IV secretion system protein VirB5